MEQQHWTLEEENILTLWRDNSHYYALLYEKAYHRYTIYDWTITIFNIFISALLSAVSFMSTNVSESNAFYVNVMSGILNFLVGFLAGVYKAIDISNTRNNYMVTNKSYIKLQFKIESMLSLPVNQRDITGKTFVYICKYDYDAIQEMAKLLPPDIVNNYPIKSINALENDKLPSKTGSINRLIRILSN